MSIESVLASPGYGDASPGAKDQIVFWLKGIEGIGQLNHLEDIIRACDKLWKSPQHKHFTTHGLPHSARIVTKLADWLAANHPKTMDALEPMEAFLLMGAAYLHDVGMQCMSPDFLRTENILFTPHSIAVPHYDLLEAIRRSHACLSQHMIRDACRREARVSRQLPLDAQSFALEAQLMSVMSRHHVGPVADILPTIRDAKFSHAVTPPVRLMLLIHLLRICDSLDADARRLNTTFLESIEFASIPPKDQFHTLKHFYTANIERRGIGEFVFHYVLPADARDLYPEIARASERYLREHLEIAGDLLNRSGIAFSKVESCIDETETWVCPYILTLEARAEFGAVPSEPSHHRGNPKIEGPKPDPVAINGIIEAGRAAPPGVGFDQRGQTVVGNQQNIDGDATVNIRT